MFILTLLITCLGVLAAGFFFFIEVFMIIKSGDPETRSKVKIPRNYVRVSISAFVFIAFWLINCLVAYHSVGSGWNIEVVFFFRSLLLLYAMCQVFDLEDYLVFHNHGYNMFGTAWSIKRFAYKQGWIR